MCGQLSLQFIVVEMSTIWPCYLFVVSGIWSYSFD